MKRNVYKNDTESNAVFIEGLGSYVPASDVKRLIADSVDTIAEAADQASVERWFKLTPDWLRGVAETIRSGKS